MYIYMYIYVYIYMYIYVYMYIYMYVHIYIYPFQCIDPGFVRISAADALNFDAHWRVVSSFRAVRSIIYIYYNIVYKYWIILPSSKLT